MLSSQQVFVLGSTLLPCFLSHVYKVEGSCEVFLVSQNCLQQEHFICDHGADPVFTPIS